MSQTDAEPPAHGGRPARILRTNSGAAYALPLFLPVYRRRDAFVPIEDWKDRYGVEGCIINAFFLSLSD